MDENKSMEDQTLSEAETEAFDSEWGETVSDDDTGEEAPAAAPEESAEPEAPEQGAEEPAGEEAPETNEQKPDDEAGDQQEEGHQLFTLKHLGENKQVGLEEMTALAQKGLDYDHVRKERDELRSNGLQPSDYAQLQAKAAWLEEIAELTGSSVEELMLRTRASKLMRDDEDLSEMDAIIRAQAEIGNIDTSSRVPAEQVNAPADTDANLKRFMEAFPDVRAENIPEEVWKDSFAHNGDLTGAYTRWENKQLRSQLAQIKQTQQNKERSTGSRKSAGATTPIDPFDEAWDS